MNALNRNYLNELKDEHTAAGHIMGEINSFIRTKDARMAAHTEILRNALLAHIKKEDEKLYAELRKTANDKNIEMVKITIDVFSTAMKGIAERILRFFEKYPGREAILKDMDGFQKGFLSVMEDISKRVEKEEKILYPMYEKHCC